MLLACTCTTGSCARLQSDRCGKRKRVRNAACGRCLQHDRTAYEASQHDIPNVRVTSRHRLRNCKPPRPGESPFVLLFDLLSWLILGVTAIFYAGENSVS